MNNLYSKNGKLLTDQNEILPENHNYYKKLYSTKGTEQVNLNDILENEVSKRSEGEKIKLDQSLQYEEFLSSLKRMPNNSSLSSSGFTVPFYKLFWNDISHFLKRSLNDSFQKEELSVTLK